MRETYPLYPTPAFAFSLIGRYLSIVDWVRWDTVVARYPKLPIKIEKAIAELRKQMLQKIFPEVPSRACLTIKGTQWIPERIQSLYEHYYAPRPSRCDADKRYRKLCWLVRCGNWQGFLEVKPTLHELLTIRDPRRHTLLIDLILVWQANWLGSVYQQIVIPNFKTRSSELLYWAVCCNQVSEVRSLLRLPDVDVNLRCVYQRVPLWIAAFNGHLEIVKALIAAGAEVNVADKFGVTPLYVAAEKGHLAVVEALIAAGADPKAARTNDATPLHAAAFNGHSEVVKALIRARPKVNLNARTNEGVTPLWMAAEKGHPAVVEALIAEKALVNVANKCGWTPLHEAAFNGHSEIVKALIAAGAEVNVADKFGVTPLYVAAEIGHLAVVEALIAKKALANVANKYGWTPLHTAAFNGHSEVVRALIQARPKVNLNARTNMGHTPFEYAAWNRHVAVARLLSENHAIIDREAISYTLEQLWSLYDMKDCSDILKVLLDEYIFIRSSEKDPTSRIYRFFNYTCDQKLDAATALREVLHGRALNKFSKEHHRALTQGLLGAIFKASGLSIASHARMAVVPIEGETPAAVPPAGAGAGAGC